MAKQRSAPGTSGPPPVQPHRDRTVLVALIGAAATVTAAVIGVYAGHSSATSAPAATPDRTAVAASAVDPVAAPPAAPAAAPAHAVIFDGEVTVPRHAAVDVDSATPSVRDDQVGPTGAFDLYHDSGEVRTDNFQAHGGGDVFPYPSGASTAPAASYDVCKDYTGPSPSYNNPRQSAPIFVGAPFCFVTSSRHLAWASVEGVQDGNETAVVRVRVWDTVV